MIIGTAGHIDHGKTSLVHALTGIDTDRLREEKRRGITIELGFAYQTVSSQSGKDIRIGFVDVPGHEKLIHTMVAGAASIDFILLVIAADDGIMPQTIEHLQILSFLGKKKGLIVVTKSDLIDYPQQEVLRQKIHDFLQTRCFASFLADAAIVFVSAKTGEGIDALKTILACEACMFQPADASGYLRYGIDRVFNLKGHGTIVTGSVLSGTVAIGDSVLVTSQTSSKAVLKTIPARIRSLHVKDLPAQMAYIGDRVALNLTGEKSAYHGLQRGDMILDPFLNRSSCHFDAYVTISTEEKKPLTQWFACRFYHGMQNVSARLVLLEGENLLPGQRALVQIVTEKPLFAVWGNRFILRDSSAIRTIGGGIIIDPYAPKRKRRSFARLAWLKAMAEENPLYALKALLSLPPFIVDWTEFIRIRNLGAQRAEEILSQIECVTLSFEDHKIVVFQHDYRYVLDHILQTIQEFHQTHPEFPGMGWEQLRKKLFPQLKASYFRALLSQEIKAGRVKQNGGWIAYSTHEVVLSAQDAVIWDQIHSVLQGEKRFHPPRTRDFAIGFSMAEAQIRHILKLVSRRGQVFEIAQDYFFLGSTLNEITMIIESIVSCQPKGEFIAADLRDRLGNGRKIAILLLEFFDQQGITIRTGDKRRLNWHCRNFFKNDQKTL